MRKATYLLFLVAVLPLVQSCADSSGGGLLFNSHTEKIQDSIPLNEALAAAEAVVNASATTYENEELAFTWRFVPSAYFVARENTADSLIEDTQAAYAAKSSFQLEIKALKFHDELLKYRIAEVNDYYQRIEYYSFHFGRDVQLVLDNDTISCTEHHFERTYGISPNIKLSVNFNVPELRVSRAKHISIVLFDRIYDQGIIKFSPDTKNIKTFKVTNS